MGIDAARQVARLADVPALDLGRQPVESLLGAGRSQIDDLLPEYLRDQRWFARKDQTITSARIADLIPVGDRSHLAMVDVRYADAPSEFYALPIATTPHTEATSAANLLAPIAQVDAANGRFVLSDAMVDPSFDRALIELMRSDGAVEGVAGSLRGIGGASIRDAVRGVDGLTVTPLSLHTSNTNIKVDLPDATQLSLKGVRRFDQHTPKGVPSIALDGWKGSHLTDDAKYANTPRIYGSVEWTPAGGAPRTVSVLSQFVPNDGDSWSHALANLDDVIAAARTQGANAPDVAAGIARYEQTAATHGRRLGQLHVALSSGKGASEFRGVTPTAAQLDAEAAARAAAVAETAGALGTKQSAAEAERFRQSVAGALARLDSTVATAAPSARIHTHGDFHLGQMLNTGDDVQIIDLEGAPMASLAERWSRSDALADVARQRSSYEYAAHQALRSGAATPQLRGVADQWAQRAQTAFLNAWRDTTRGHSFVPADSVFDPALQRAELHNALYEMKYELGSRPDWLDTPFARVRRIVGDVHAST